MPVLRNAILLWAGTLLLLCVLAGAARAADAQTWLGSWAHVPTAYNLTRPTSTAPYSNVTVRQVARISAGADRLRLRFSNEFGDAPLLLGGVHVALAGEDGAILPGSDHVVRFSGRASAVIAPGAPLLSDPLDWPLPAFTRLAVSIFYPQESRPPAHALLTLPAYVSAPGDHGAAIRLPGAVPARSGNALSQIDIVPIQATRTLVGFGDSLTEGAFSTLGGFADWPDRLAERLQADPATRGWSVVNAGIGSNRLLHDTPGVNALARFDRDVLSVPGVAAVIILEGINDIQYSHRNPAEAVSADDMIAALGQLAARAHARGVRVVMGTLTPFEGSPDYTQGGEAMRQAVNRWIRGAPELDGVIDFDAATRDPAAPTRLRADTQTSDHLHPGDAGYAAMGEAIDLALFALPK